ncbi:heterokaryon incompatibility protein-domain-containing protein [Paraphoma chrysanthemicola]|uniref:Heterokaryon incompatibility protein-domain-containing protein n=1 Tax=Paraphoma chrysanthemicola TaxID=798071 RepID=A0A8K0RB72_9PLEO|nr:heterokaryon incompatibility protein-domain-containing protein [Paraphoma chrysanthemicola]
MSEPERAMPCDLCSALLEMFQGVRKEQIDISAFQSQSALECTEHTSLVEGFRAYCQSGSRKSNRRSLNDMGFYARGTLGQVSLTESLKNFGCYWELLLCPSADSAEEFAKGDIMDPDWIDMTKVKQWKADCLASHGSKCDNPLKIWTTTPAWFVDVELECIVPGKQDASFVALSYTYGDHFGLKVDDALSARLQEPRSLRAPEIASRIPPSLIHAMFITRSLDERYLWVDALCIGHDSPAETTRQLGMMGSIYASAALTIIAADGDAEDGIVGLDGASESRGLEQKIFSLGTRQVIVRDAHIFSLTDSATPYFSRAWTFQEHRLAKRKLFFLNKSAHWECCLWQSHEELAPGAEIHTYIEPRLVEILEGFPELGSLSNIIGEYNTKVLRYPEDALPGIIGLLAVLSRSFEGGFLFGIPEMFFHRALAWNPHWAHTELKRRTESDRPRQAQLLQGHLPSWSWIGWEGLFNLGEEETYPIVEWYTASSPLAGESERRRIRSNWYEHREEWKSRTTQLPGWTAVDMENDEGTYRGEPRIFPAGCGGRVYCHQNMIHNKNYGPTNDWYFPFPVPNISSATEPSMPDQTPFLFSRTQRSFVLGRRTKNTRYSTADDDDANKIINLYDGTSGRSIGTLHLHSKEQSKQFPFAKDEPTLSPEDFRAHHNSFLRSKGTTSLVIPVDPTDEDLSKIEIVAVSMTRYDSKTWNKEASRFEKPFTTTEVINVLWIEWENNIAYRKAVGLVWKENWEQLELDDIDLVLG